jgi:hypothetical protein
MRAIMSRSWHLVPAEKAMFEVSGGALLFHERISGCDWKAALLPEPLR